MLLYHLFYFLFLILLIDNNEIIYMIYCSHGNTKSKEEAVCNTVGPQVNTGHMSPDNNRPRPQELRVLSVS